MFTVCPKCTLTLVVTAEDLRVAQGYVRCGRCSSVFNALARLTEAASPAPPVQAAPQTAPPPAGAPDEEAIPEQALEFDSSKTDVAKLFVEASPTPQWTAATGSFRAMLAANQEAMPAEEEPAGAAAERQAAPEESAAPGESAPAQAPDTAAEPPAAMPAAMHETPAGAASGPAQPPAGHPGAAGEGAGLEFTDAAGAGDDEDIEVELDPAFLASILRAEVPPAPEPQAQRAPPAPPTPDAEPSRAAAPAAPPTARASDAARSPPAAPTAPPVTPAPEAARPPVAAPAAPAPDAARPRVAVRAAPPARTMEVADFDPVPAASRAARAAHEALRAVVAAADDAQASRLMPYAWRAGALLALLALLAQILNHHRDELAAMPRFHAPLTALYGALGVKLTPHWDLHAYDVRQLGATGRAGGAGLITVRASIRNLAPVAQPLPLLRVTLQDRFSNRIAARDVAPAVYLLGAARSATQLDPGARVDAEMGFVDPGANAAGFEIDACLPTRGGEVSCANDLLTR